MWNAEDGRPLNMRADLAVAAAADSYLTYILEPEPGRYELVEPVVFRSKFGAEVGPR